jgi:Pregnancy-associated plasma protein-A/Secretion system C-terminal sorting domain
MKAVLFYVLVSIGFVGQLAAQKRCATVSYTQTQLQKNLSVTGNNTIATFSPQDAVTTGTEGVSSGSVITIPVVVHILYHNPSEKISDAVVIEQLKTLNQCFRRQHADSVNTPAVFKSLAADCEIEFKLATSDPKKRYTTGIVRKYTPVTSWSFDDKMKFSAEMGDDAWDTKSYLNIWVCNLADFAGYSSIIGGPQNVDGLVLSFSTFGAGQKTIVHEAGHWLNLKHLWGDDNCGDDGVADTPKQAGYTAGCPTGVRITCSNSPNGDMYSNYMDFTSDECTNLFTVGQKARMKALFATGGLRNSFLFSKGLDAPLIFEIPVPEEDPKWLHPRLYPVPATTQLTLDLSYDVRWVGKTIQVTNLQGQTIMVVTITSKIQLIDISRLQPGMYFLAAKKGDGESIKQKFIKL